MRIYSDIIPNCKKSFSTVEELNAAEKAYLEEQEAKRAEEEQKNDSRKEAAKKVDAANVKLEEAYKEYEKAQKTAEKILQAADEEVVKIYDNAKVDVDNLMSPVKKALADAQSKKCEALNEFNTKFGPYTIKLTGEEAQKEFDRWTAWAKSIWENNSLFSKLFDNLF